MAVIYGSVCSGIEAASVAWEPLGWGAAFLSEIEPFPRAVLAHHYPNVPRHGDFTIIYDGFYDKIDLLVGGTPCQDFSIAGLRAGITGDRGNLTLEFVRLAARLHPRWLLWENVPGVLSSNGGRAFGTFLGALAELGYGFAYRVLDAQYFGLAQRRKRVFVVGYLGDWRRAAAVLFEHESLRGDPAPRREAGPGVAALTANGVGTCGADGNQARAGHLIAAFGGNNSSGAIEVSTALNAHGVRIDFESETFVTHSLRGEGFDASEDGTGRGIPLVPAYAIQERAVSENIDAGPQGKGYQEGLTYTLEARNTVQAVAYRTAGAHPPAIAFSCKDHGADATAELAPILRATGGQMAVAFNLRGREGGSQPEVAEVASLRAASGGSYVAQSVVRRLTPTECEFLQGFPRGYTDVPYRGKPAADGPRYKALGNSMAVPVMHWLGQRIQMIEDMTS